MADKICELCRSAYAKDMRFGVSMCKDCLAEYSAAMRGDRAAAARMANRDNYPNATERARDNIISALAVHKVLPEDDEVPADNSSKRAAAPMSVMLAEDQGDELFASLYSNIGGKLKGGAKAIFIFGAIAAIILGLSWLSAEGPMGLLIIIVGVVAAWIGSWALYAVGELVEKTAANERNTRGILQLMLEECEKGRD